jgi:hypothetical protein
MAFNVILGFLLSQPELWVHRVLFKSILWINFGYKGTFLEILINFLLLLFDHLFDLILLPHMYSF